MGEENPYQPPGEQVSYRNIASNAKVEKLLSERLLEARDRGGYTLFLFYRWSTTRYVVIMIYFTLVLAFLASAELWNIFALIAGLLVGMLARDFGWARSQAKMWPAQARLLDWDKVQRMADGEPVA
jgi:hypothetical protein